MASLLTFITDNPLEAIDQAGLVAFRQRALDRIAFEEEFGRTEGIDDARMALDLVDKEIARREDLIANAGTFNVGMTVRIVRELQDWNTGCSAEPAVGMEGVVVSLDEADAKHLPRGKVPVRLSMAELGYEVEEADVDDAFRVFYVWAWALEVARPEKSTNAPPYF